MKSKINFIITGVLLSSVLSGAIPLTQIGNALIDLNGPNQITYNIYKNGGTGLTVTGKTITLSTNFFDTEANPKNFKVLVLNGINTLVYFINATEFVIVPLSQVLTANVDRSNPLIINYITEITTKTTVKHDNGGGDRDKDGKRGDINKTKPTPEPTQPDVTVHPVPTDTDATPEPLPTVDPDPVDVTPEPTDPVEPNPTEEIIPTNPEEIEPTEDVEIDVDPTEQIEEFPNDEDASIDHVSPNPVDASPPDEEINDEGTADTDVDTTPDQDNDDSSESFDSESSSGDEGEGGSEDNQEGSDTSGDTEDGDASEESG